MQDYHARLLNAKTKNPELFASLFKYKLDYRDIRDGDTIKKSEVEESKAVRTPAPNISIVLGSAGSGKSTAVVGTHLNILKQTNRLTRV